MLIKQMKKVVDIKKVERLVDASYEIDEPGTVWEAEGCYGDVNTLVLYNGRIDKDYFNHLATKHTDFPRHFDRDCHYRVTMCLENGRIFVNKTSGTEKYTPHYHRPEYVNGKPPTKKDRRSFYRS